MLSAITKRTPADEARRPTVAVSARLIWLRGCVGSNYIAGSALHNNVYIYTAVYSQTPTAISIFKYDNIVCIVQVHIHVNEVFL